MQYVNLDEELAVCKELSEEDIWSEVMNKKVLNRRMWKKRKPDLKPQSLQLQRLFSTCRYIEEQTDISEAVFNSLNVLQDFS